MRKSSCGMKDYGTILRKHLQSYSSRRSPFVGYQHGDIHSSYSINRQSRTDSTRSSVVDGLLLTPTSMIARDRFVHESRSP